MVGPAIVALALSAAAPYGPGEEMSFAVTYLGIRVGLASISSLPLEDEHLPVALEARTVGLGAILKLNERISSALDLATGLPTRSRLDADEKGRRHTELTTFDRAADQATVRNERVRDGQLQVKTDVLPVPAGATDLLALVYRLRTLPLVVGLRQTFPVLSGTTLREVEAVVEGREQLETRAGTFPTLRIRVPLGFGGSFSEKNPTRLWLSDDARRIVVKLSTDFSIGRAVAELRAYRAASAPIDTGDAPAR